MSTFDGSTGSVGGALMDDSHGFDDGPEPGVNTLDLLRDALAQQAEIEPCTITVPGVPIQLVCSTDITSKQLTSWQRKALPPALRNSSNISPLSMDQSVVSSQVLIRTTLQVNVEDRARPGTWKPITDEDGNLLTFRDTALVRSLGAMDDRSALKRLFPRDSDLTRASQQVLDAAGWTENRVAALNEDGDGEDPTV